MHLEEPFGEIWMQNDSQFSLKHFDTQAEEEEDPTSSMAF
jgi:hypothetical protein